MIDKYYTPSHSFATLKLTKVRHQTHSLKSHPNVSKHSFQPPMLPNGNKTNTMHLVNVRNEQEAISQDPSFVNNRLDKKRGANFRIYPTLKNHVNLPCIHPPKLVI